MTGFIRAAHVAKLAFALGAALTLAACSSNKAAEGALGGGPGGLGMGAGAAGRPARRRISSSMSATACSSRPIRPT